MKSITRFWTVLLTFSLMVLAHTISMAGVDRAIEDSKSILPMRDRVKLMEKWWKWKHEHVLPMVMREQGIDMWLVRNNEADLYYNNEGPVYTSLLPANHEGMTLPSRHVRPGSQKTPSFMMFHDTGRETEYVEPRDYEHITLLVEERDPKKIAIGQYNSDEMVRARFTWVEGASPCGDVEDQRGVEQRDR